MLGPIRFVFAVIWLAIALQTAGLLKDATLYMLGHAVKAHQHGGIKMEKWSRTLTH